MDCNAALFLLVVALAASPADATEPGAFDHAGRQEDASTVSVLPSFGFNGDDSHVGLAVCLGVLPETLTGISLGLDARLWHKVTPHPIRPHFAMQVKETRFIPSIQVDQRLPLRGRVEAFAAAGVGYSLGYYEGTRIEPEEGWTPILHGGLVVSIGNDRRQPIHVRLGYRYLDNMTYEVPDRWWTLTLRLGG